MNNNGILKLFLLMVLGAMVALSACNDDEGPAPDPDPDPDPDPVEMNKTTGFVLSVITPNNTSLAKYFETIPSGTADLSDGIDFQNFNVQDAFNGALYLQNTGGANGLSKIVIDDDGEFKVDGSFTTGGRVDPIAVRDAETGVYFDYGDTKKLFVFDPTNMTNPSSIDMSGALFPRDEATRYRELFLRDNLVFAPLASGAGPVWYNPLVIHVADLNAGTFVGNITVDLRVPVRHNQFFGGKYVDESGNLYIPDDGDLLTATPSRIHRVNAGTTDVDLDYEFDVSGTLNPRNLVYRAFNGFYYIGDGKALASVTADTPVQVLAILASVNGDLRMLTQAQLVEIQMILNAAENAPWCVIDLNAKTVTPIEGVPAQNVNHRFTISEFDGKWYLPVETSSEIAYYSYDPATGATAKAFDVVGGEIGNFINIANNN